VNRYVFSISLLFATPAAMALDACRALVRLSDMDLAMSPEAHRRLPG
jgi:hypothetical protein